MWLNQLKIALIEKNTDTIDKLLIDMPIFDNVDDMKSAQALLKESLILLHTLKDATASSMKQLQTNINYLNATQSSTSTMLDIKS
jgi:hypothetical protein